MCVGWVTLASAAVGPQHWYDRLAANVEWVPRGNRAVALSNRSLALLKLGRPQEAHDDAEAAVESLADPPGGGSMGLTAEGLGPGDEYAGGEA